MAAPRKQEEPAPAPPSATDRLAAAQAALADTTSKIAELDQQYNESLLADDNAGAVKLGIEITNLKLEARAHARKCELVKEKAAEEERARKAAEKAALVEKIEAKIAQRDGAMEGVAAAIKQLVSASERAIELGREIIDAWTWPMHDLPPALLTPPSIMTAISQELFRTSHHPRRFGGADTDVLAGHALPGSRAPTLQLAENPSRVRPLLDVVTDASAFAKNFLRTGKGSATVEVVATPVPANGQGHGPGTPQLGKPPSDLAAREHADFSAWGAKVQQRTGAEQRLSDLLIQMSKLAEDGSEEGERRYHEVVGEIAKLQGAQHG
jgi:hypothetical protein